jgi:predicted DNA-binding transcriptional regulator AlpA
MKTQFISPEDRYGLSRSEAASYIGVSVSLFDQLVADGRMPPPRNANSRNIWKRAELEQAFDELPSAGQKTYNGESANEELTIA